MNRRKELQQEYAMKKRVMGVFQFVNTASGKRYIASSSSLESAESREEFMLRMNSHMNKALQEDWNASDGAAFVYEVLEELKLGDEIRNDFKDMMTPEGELRRDLVQGYRRELSKLEDKWREQLGSYEPEGYNKRRRV
ncbi:aspartate/tyrosine/aromatic aminotransferase [Paenibacillus phyllosphaerae]|uniref:Aspartate/tyrosine/aromatic aminotransferase n=1 Tax=Paenibacillus phyllosphaerae TaxID=274593 RepID=A0A7W5FQ06_9BACL|nr:GIY-YIG nuclease family protein [Paenibacillus phyllosphaerae]MBB3112991.1 aspartate/tyrosine/aromatic aminotransferase [Paenibacillus phyllosphaerae]